MNYYSYAGARFCNDRLNSIEETFNKLINQVDFDTITFTGYSGAMIAPILARKFNKKMLLIRKKGDISHSRALVEGNYNVDNYLIIDDFIDSGKTINNIITGVNSIIGDVYRSINSRPNCVGIFCYEGFEYQPCIYGQYEYLFEHLPIYSITQDYEPFKYVHKRKNNGKLEKSIN